MSNNLLAQNSLEFLNQLDWQEIISRISSNLYFDSSKVKIKSPPRAKSIDEIEKSFNSLDFFNHIILENQLPSIRSSLTELDSSIRMEELSLMLKKQRILDLQELHQLAKSVEAYDKVLPLIVKWPALRDHSISGADLLAIRKNFVFPLRQFVDSTGQIDYFKHPLLGKHYLHLQNLENSIRTIIKDIIHRPSISPLLQFSEYDLIHDHYVLAVRSDSYQASLGRIIAHSESGSTLFIEPFELREKHNERLNLLAKIEEILTKICQTFSSFLFTYHSIFWQIQALFEEIDLISGKAQFCHEHEFIRPELLPYPNLSVKGLFHPLISNAVKNDIELSSDCKGLILSGPNTGGKTATLKALCLCQLFLHFGLFIPALEAQIHPFTGLFYFGNDQQNLTQGLSSFSSEVKNYLELFQHLSFTNFIFIDEIFNSTSSEEASALAKGLFEEIHSLSVSKIIVSTHHQMLKTIMHSNKGYLSGHVGFDLENQSPTYKLIIGVPGSSYALSIFSILSKQTQLQTSIEQKAREVLDQKNVYYEGLLQEVSQKNIQLDRLLDQNRRLEKDLLNQKKSQEGILKLKMEALLKDAESRVQKIVKEAVNVLESVKKGEIQKGKAFEKKLQTIHGSLKEERDKVPSPQKNEHAQFSYSKSPENIVIGHYYYSTFLKKIIKVTGINEKKGEVISKSGIFTLTCGIDTLREVPSQIQKAQKEKQTKQFHFHVEKDENNVNTRLDARGVRLEDFQDKIEKALSDLLLGAIPFLLVIHGHGEGVLKGWLRNYLKKRPEFSWEIPKEFSDGATRIFIQWTSQSSMGET